MHGSSRMSCPPMNGQLSQGFSIDNTHGSQDPPSLKSQRAAKKKNVSRRGTAFTKEEDLVVRSAFLNISKDPITGNSLQRLLRNLWPFDAQITWWHNMQVRIRLQVVITRGCMIISMSISLKGPTVARLRFSIGGHWFRKRWTSSVGTKKLLIGWMRAEKMSRIGYTSTHVVLHLSNFHMFIFWIGLVYTHMCRLMMLYKCMRGQNLLPSCIAGKNFAMRPNGTISFLS